MYEDLILLLLLLLRGKTGIIKFKAGLLNSMILILRPSGNVRRLSGALQLLIQNTAPHMCLPLPKKNQKQYAWKTLKLYAQFIIVIEVIF